MLLLVVVFLLGILGKRRTGYWAYATFVIVAWASGDIIHLYADGANVSSGFALRAAGLFFFRFIPILVLIHGYKRVGPRCDQARIRTQGGAILERFYITALFVAFFGGVIGSTAALIDKLSGPIALAAPYLFFAPLFLLVCIKHWMQWLFRNPEQAHGRTGAPQVKSATPGETGATVERDARIADSTARILCKGCCAIAEVTEPYSELICDDCRKLGRTVPAPVGQETQQMGRQCWFCGGGETVGDYRGNPVCGNCVEKLGTEERETAVRS